MFASSPSLSARRWKIPHGDRRSTRLLAISARGRDHGRMTQKAPPAAAPRAPRWLTVVGWVAFACAVLLSGCATTSGERFAHEATCGPNPPTEWRLECTYVALAASALCLLPALVLLLRRRVIGAVIALLLAAGSIIASMVGYLLPVFASALC